MTNTIDCWDLNNFDTCNIIMGNTNGSAVTSYMTTLNGGNATNYITTGYGYKIGSNLIFNTKSWNYQTLNNEDCCPIPEILLIKYLIHAIHAETVEISYNEDTYSYVHDSCYICDRNSISERNAYYY